MIAARLSSVLQLGPAQEDHWEVGISPVFELKVKVEVLRAAEAEKPTAIDILNDDGIYDIYGIGKSIKW